MLKEKWISYILCNLQVDNCKEKSICVLLIKYKILSGWWLFGKMYIYIGQKTKYFVLCEIYVLYSRLIC